MFYNKSFIITQRKMVNNYSQCTNLSFGVVQAIKFWIGREEIGIVFLKFIARLVILIPRVRTVFNNNFCYFIKL